MVNEIRKEEFKRNQDMRKHCFVTLLIYQYYMSAVKKECRMQNFNCWTMLKVLLSFILLRKNTHLTFFLGKFKSWFSTMQCTKTFAHSFLIQKSLTWKILIMIRWNIHLFSNSLIMKLMLLNNTSTFNRGNLTK